MSPIHTSIRRTECTSEARTTSVSGALVRVEGYGVVALSLSASASKRMAKRKKKNAGVGIDFSKVKTKVGKRIKKNANETRIDPANLKTTTLRVAHQNALEYDVQTQQTQSTTAAAAAAASVAAKEGGLVRRAEAHGNRGAALKPATILLAEAAAHPAAAHRRRCVEALTSSLSAPSSTNADMNASAGFKSELLRVTCLRLADESDAVRKAARVLIDVVLQTYAASSKANDGDENADGAGTALSPFADSFASQLAGCIANPVTAVQKVALDATSAVLASRLGKEMKRATLEQLMAQVGVLLAGNRSSNVNRGIIGGRGLRVAQLECVRCGAAILEETLASPEESEKRKRRRREIEHTRDESEGGDASAMHTGCMLWHRRMRFMIGALSDSSPAGMQNNGGGGDSGGGSGSSGSVNMIFEVPKLVHDAASCFAECGPADLAGSPDEVLAMKSAGAIDCMVVSTRCLCALIKYMKELAGIERTNMDIAARVQSSSSGVSTTSSWGDACAASLDAVQLLVLPHIPAYEPIDVNVRIQDLKELRDALEGLNLAGLELVAEISRCHEAILPGCGDAGLPEARGSSAAGVRGEIPNRATGLDAKMMRLACEALQTGSLLLPRDPHRQYSSQSHVSAVKQRSLRGEKLDIVIAAIYHLMTATPSHHGVQHLLMDALCTRIEANIASKPATSEDDRDDIQNTFAYLKLVYELIDGVLAQSADCGKYEAAVVHGFCEQLATRLPQAVWELRVRAPRCSELALDVLLSAAKLARRSDALRDKMYTVTQQLAPLVAYQKAKKKTKKKGGGGEGADDSSTIRTSEEIFYAMGPIIKLPSPCRATFTSLLYYLPAPLPRALLRSLAVAVLTRSVDTVVVGFSMRIVRTVGLRGRRLTRDDNEDEDNDDDGGGRDDEGHVQRTRVVAKEEIQNCTSFLVSILCGRIEGVAGLGIDDAARRDACHEARCRDVCVEASRALCEWLAPDVVVAVVIPKIEAEARTMWTSASITALTRQVVSPP